MAGIARVVAQGYPHHVTQGGNRRQRVFFNDEDYQAYLDLLFEWCVQEGLEVWAYCSGARLRGEYGAIIRSPKPLGSPREWASLQKGGLAEVVAEAIRRRARTGRPLGSNRFIQGLEGRLGRTLKPQKPGRKKKAEE
ncbi:MAG: transposase [Acidobacteriota bacterium]